MPTFGTCDCCGTTGPLQPSFVDNAPLCPACMIAEHEGITVAEAGALIARLTTA